MITGVCSFASLQELFSNLIVYWFTSALTTIILINIKLISKRVMCAFKREVQKLNKVVP